MKDLAECYFSTNKGRRTSVSDLRETLTLSWRRPISYRNQSIDLLRKYWFLYDIGLHHERVKVVCAQKSDISRWEIYFSPNQDNIIFIDFIITLSRVFIQSLKTTIRKFDALRNLVPLLQCKKCEKHSWKSVTFSKACSSCKSNSPPRVFFTLFEFYKWYQIAQSIRND